MYLDVSENISKVIIYDIPSAKNILRLQFNMDIVQYTTLYKTTFLFNSLKAVAELGMVISILCSGHKSC